MAKGETFSGENSFPPWPKKYFGQNFLISEFHSSRIVEIADLTRADTVVEIGPGRGAITKKLAATEARVFALEIDVELFDYLSAELAGIDNLTILNADALTFDFKKTAKKSKKRLKIVANLPYNVSTRILFRLLEHRHNIEKMALMFQKEVADRITASPGGKNYGALSIFPQLCADITVALKLPPGAFYPAPKVKSSVLLFDILKKQRFEVKNEKFLRDLIQSGFSQRRKKLLNSLKNFFQDDETLKTALDISGIDGSRRIETLSIEEMCALGNTAYDISHR